MSNILTQGIKETVADLEPSACQSLVSRMEQYIKEIILFNSAYNLTNTSEPDELAVRHILDSLAGYQVIRNSLEKMSDKGRQLVVGDIGSGGGLPGIPLAAALPWVSFKLVERMEKRCAFLENCAAILGLKNVSVVNSEAERLPEGAYDLITFRAFRPLDKKMTKTLLRIVKEGGCLCAYKAKAESIREEMAGITALVPGYQVAPLAVPGLENSERNLVIIRK